MSDPALTWRRSLSLNYHQLVALQMLMMAAMAQMEMLMTAAMAQMETNDFFDFYLDDFEPRINYRYYIRRHSVSACIELNLRVTVAGYN